MESPNYLNLITKNNFNLKYFGFFLEDFSMLSIWYKLYCFMVHVMFMGILNISMVISWMLNANSLESFAATGYIILTCLSGQLKIILFLSKKKDVLKLAEQLHEEQFYPRNQAEWNVVHQEFSFMKKTRTVLIVYSYLSIFSLIFSPIFNNKNNGLPVPAWYPINVTVSPYHEIAYLHQSVSAILVGLAYVFSEITFTGISTCIGMQCNILSLRNQNVANNGGSSKEMQKSLIECVAHHWKIMKLLKTSEKVFGNTYILQFFCCIMTLCMDLFLLSMTDPKSFEFFYLVVYYTAISGLLLVPCWFASEMTKKSENIPNATYNCDWIEADDNFKKDMLYFIQISQRPLKFFAINLFEISVETFVKIMRTSLSYFVVLHNLQNT